MPEKRLDYQTTLGIEIALAEKFKHKDNIILTNQGRSVGCHECDILVIDDNFNASEIEIKISKNDLMGEKKKKHSHYDERIGEMYFCIPIDLYEKIQISEYIYDEAGVLVSLPGRRIKLKRRAKNRGTGEKFSANEVITLVKNGLSKLTTLKTKICVEQLIEQPEYAYVGY